MKRLEKHAGFTLIELVVVIVILGILSATAVPKFIDLTSDAKTSVIDGVKGVLNSAADVAHAKAIIEGELNEDGTITVGSESVSLKWGWPDEAGIATMTDIDTDIQELVIAASEATTYTHVDVTDGTCFVTYDVSSVTSSEIRPAITSVDC